MGDTLKKVKPGDPSSPRLRQVPACGTDRRVHHNRLGAVAAEFAATMKRGQENSMSADPAETPRLVSIGPGFCVRQAIDNIAWIDMGEYAVVVDALEQPELEEEVFAAIQSTLGDKPIRYVLNTHTHGDHVALNEAFRRRYRSQIVNARTTPIPAEGRWFEGPRRRVLLLALPGCHTQEDCVVWVEPERALFAGDIFGWGLIPLSVNLNADTARLLVGAYERLIQFDPAVVIPGHGPLCTREELRRWLDYFAWLQREVARTCAEGRDDEEILRRIAPPEDMRTWWRFLQWKHQDSLAKVLSSVRQGWLKG